jgi:hypothetical protein
VLNAAGVLIQSNVRANRLVPSPRQPITAASATLAMGDDRQIDHGHRQPIPDTLATSSIRQMTQK